MHLKHSTALDKLGFTWKACGPFTKTRNEYKNLKTQEIQDTFIQRNQIKPVFYMI